MHKQYFGIVFSISLIAQPMMAAHMSVIEWKGTPQQSMGVLLLPNRKGFSKITQLSQNIVKGDTAGAQKLIDAQTNNQSRASFVNSYGSDPYKVTPLHYAAGKGNDNLINMLLTAGANPNAQDSSQCTPLMWAISNGKDKAATLLASKTDLTIRDNLGRTALHWAAAKVNQAVATTLLSQGAAVRAKDNQGNTPLHYAVSVKYRFGKHDPQDDSGAAMSGKFVQAATIATAGMQPTQQNQAIMNKAINLGIATPVAGVASFAGGKGSGVVILTPNAQGTGVNAIGMPVSDTANPTPISPDVATIVNSSQASPTQVLQAAGGASARQNASGVAAQANAYQALSNVYASMSKMSLTQYTSAVQQLQSAMGSSRSISSHIDIDAIEVNTQMATGGVASAKIGEGEKANLAAFRRWEATPNELALQKEGSSSGRPSGRMAKLKPTTPAQETTSAQSETVAEYAQPSEALSVEQPIELPTSLQQQTQGGEQLKSVSQENVLQPVSEEEVVQTSPKSSLAPEQLTPQPKAPLQEKVPLVEQSGVQQPRPGERWTYGVTEKEQLKNVQLKSIPKAEPKATYESDLSREIKAGVKLKPTVQYNNPVPEQPGGGVVDLEEFARIQNPIGAPINQDAMNAAYEKYVVAHIQEAEGVATEGEKLGIVGEQRLPLSKPTRPMRVIEPEAQPVKGGAVEELPGIQASSAQVTESYGEIIPQQATIIPAEGESAVVQEVAQPKMVSVPQKIGTSEFRAVSAGKSEAPGLRGNVEYQKPNLLENLQPAEKPEVKMLTYEEQRAPAPKMPAPTTEIAAPEANTSSSNFDNLLQQLKQWFSKLAPGDQEVIASGVTNTTQELSQVGGVLADIQKALQTASNAATQQVASLKSQFTSLSKSSVVNEGLIEEPTNWVESQAYTPRGITSIEHIEPMQPDVMVVEPTSAVEETVAKPGVIGQVAGYLDQVALDAWKAIPSGVIKGGMEVAARLVSQAASTVMSAASDAATAAATAAGNAIIAAAGVVGIEEGTVVAAGQTVGAALGTTVGELTGIAGSEGTILASFAGLGVVDAVMLLGMALQMAIQYGMQAQEKTDQRNKRAEIDGRRDNIIAALLKKDTKTITNNNNPYVSDFPAYLTANSKGRVPSHFAAMSGNSGPQQAINKFVNDPTVLTVVDHAGYTPLMYAIMRGRKDNLKPSGLSNVMLAQGFTRNANAMGTKTALGSFVNPMNITPLKTSLMFGGGKLFDAIFTIVHTSDVYTDTVGRNILHYAALDGKQIEKVYKAYSSVPWYTCLVSSTSSQTGAYRKMDPKANPWVTSQDMYGATPLHYAAATSANGFKFLLAKAGKVDLTTLLDKNGLTVLHYAAMCGRVEVIHEAMKHAGNKKKRDAFGEIKSKTTDTYGNAITPNLADKTAIDLASISGHPQAVRVLAKHVAESKKEKKGLLKGAKQSKRATAQQTKQQEKVSKGQSRVTKLQRREAKSKVMIDPLIAGVKAGRGNVVLAYNQPSNLTATESGTGMTALMYAVKEGREQMVKQILDALKQQKLTAEVLAMTDAKGQTASAMTKNKKIQAMLTQAASPTVAGGAVTGAPTLTTTKGKKATKAKNATSVIGKKTTNLPMNQR